MTWKYFEPEFEYEKKFDDSGWPWAGHKFFAYDLIANIKPKKVVELGTHYGTSLWSFAQSAKDQKISIELNAVDTWEGEKHAGVYGEEVFKMVKSIKSEFYSGLNIDLIRKTFDNAVSDFGDKSIDILHIDGLHTYDAVKHDFENWLPKVGDDGIVLFHDIIVKRDDFGVYKFWGELKEKYQTLELYQSYGLGILFLSRDFYLEFKDLEREWRMHYSYTNEAKKNQAIRKKIRDIQKKNYEIKVMKSSKFWKMREQYLKILDRFRRFKNFCKGLNFCRIKIGYYKMFSIISGKPIKYDFVDYGSKSGGSMALAMKKFGGKRGLGIEMKPDFVEEAKRKGHDVMLGDVTKLSLPNNFVRFTMICHFLEHLASIESVRLALKNAVRISREFVYIRGPVFDDDEYLKSLGLKTYWSDWPKGHTCHLTTGQLSEILDSLGTKSYEIKLEVVAGTPYTRHRFCNIIKSIWATQNITFAFQAKSRSKF